MLVALKTHSGHMLQNLTVHLQKTFQAICLILHAHTLDASCIYPQCSDPVA